MSARNAGNMSRPYRQLLPLLAASAGDAKLQPVSTHGATSAGDAPRQARAAHAQRRRRDTSSIACNMCRTKKTACDRIRPTCTPCSNRKTTCVYRTNFRVQDAAPDTLQRRVDALQQRLRDQADMVQTLASLPPEAAVNVLRLLQTAAEPFSVLASLQGSMHARQRPSEHRAARSAAPPTFSNVEFELNALHRAVYTSVEPASTASLRALTVPRASFTRGAHVEELGRPSPSSLSSASTASPTPLPARAGSSGTVSSSSQTPPSELFLKQPPPRYGLADQATPPSSAASATASNPPLPSAQDGFDPRLRQIQIVYWTNVPISNELAASVLSFYLNFDHHLFNIFDVDLFLSDLVACRSDFCTSFLVNTLLFLACQAYTTVDVTVSSFVHSFLRESQLLWRGLGNSTSLMTICACQIFSMGCYFYGQDDQALEALMHGRRLAEKLELFGVMPHRSSNAEHFRQQTPNWLRAASHVAWGTYNWLSVHVFYYNGEPIRHPPILPIPGATGQHQNGDFYELELPSPIHWSAFDKSTFPIICRFWTITQEVALVYLGPEVDRSRPLSEQVPLAFAEEKYQRLLSWADSLADSIDDGGSTQALIFKIWFHCIVLHTFRPFLRENNTRDEHMPWRLKTFTASDGSPDAVFDASIQQLKHLVYTYLSKLSEMPLSGFFNAAFVHVGHAMLQSHRHKNHSSDKEEIEPEESMDDAEDSPDDIDEIVNLQPTDGPARTVYQDARLYFLVCVRAWTDLYVCFPTIAEFTQAFLSMALEAGIVSGSEAQTLLARLWERGRHHESAKKATVSSLVDFDVALSRPEDASVHSLALKFDDLATFSEFTSAEDFVADDDVR